VLKLTGRVRLRNAEDGKLLDRTLRDLAVYVNGFRQSRVLADDDPHDGEQKFSVDVVLNQQKNDIKVECPGVPKEALRGGPFRVQCDVPAPNRLHLVVINTSGESPGIGELRNRAFAALNLDPRSLKSPVFSEVMPHPGLTGMTKVLRPLDGYVSKNQVRMALNEIESAMRKKDAANDVVLLYWLGKEEAGRGEHYLLTSDSDEGQDLDRTAFTIKEVLGVGRETQGARVLLLDAMSGGKGDVLAWEGAHAAVLRCAWSTKKKDDTKLLSVMEQAGQGKGTEGAEVQLIDVKTTTDQKARDLQWGKGLTGFDAYLSDLSGLVLAKVSEKK
jgi:hypothetical protein